MAETTLMDPDLAAELYDELSRLRAARALDPKHGTRAGAPQCDDRCQICVAGIQLDLLIARIPRSAMSDIPMPTGTFIDGIVPLEGSALAEALQRTEADELWVAPTLGVGFVEPWIITEIPDGPQDH